MSRVIIVGGGITGLAAAYFLEKISDCDLLILEAADKLGGKISTEHENDFLIEEGPDCFFSRKPEAFDLAVELGIEDRLIEPQQRQFMMLVEGKLCPVPRSLISFMYSDPSVIDEADFVSKEGRARAKLEPDQPLASGEDESIASFFRRRFGEEFSRKLAEPLLAGTHSGSADRLSMAALYPSYLQAERKYGSLTAAARASVEAQVSNVECRVSSRPAATTFLSFRDGMQELIAALVANLKRTEFRLKARTSRVNCDGADAAHGFERGNVILAATPAPVTAGIVAAANPELARALDQIEFKSSQAVTAAFQKDQIARTFASTGFLVPEGGPSAISGCTFASEKWFDRAPSDSILLRIFLREGCSSMEGLAQTKELLQISGEPWFTHETCWNLALPQYAVGHLRKLEAIERARQETPNIYLGGGSYRGVGVPDCIRSARQAAEAISERLGTRTTSV